MTNTLPNPIFKDAENVFISDKYLYAIRCASISDYPFKSSDGKVKNALPPECIFYLNLQGRCCNPDKHDTAKTIVAGLYYFYLSPDNNQLSSTTNIEAKDCFGPTTVHPQLNQVIHLVVKEVFFGVRFDVQQYNIDGRIQWLNLAPITWTAKREAGQADNARSGHTIYLMGDPNCQPFMCNRMIVRGTNTGATRIYKSYLLKSYATSRGEMSAKQDGEHNDNNMPGVELDPELFGQCINIRPRRSHIERNTRPTTTRRFNHEETVSRGSELVPSDKQTMMIFLYVRMRYNGQQGIYELKQDGTIHSRRVSENHFRRAAITNFITGDSLRPGIQQYYVLLDQTSSNKEEFIVRSIYCDGELIHAV
jgi:hypothetical protein